ncbi:hypothetical protein [Streptomyces rishiriensis]|uniref:Uncharacterized protein n=1 Tax=Streptomyces rishiriensis TaxID=68264 RepID=A0ABU0NI77_STRRH|nr:hypothetical protein [Streptomyces rishiriensis]MDQ0578794.1 hypothetical protein [Streptomyces rishiriensis]
MSANEPWRMSVDGQEFDVSQPDGKPGTYDFTWLTGPDPQYGFGYSTHPAVPSSMADLEAAIREFLSQVDPGTGHIE